MSKFKINKTDSMCWEIECDNVEDLNMIGAELEDQASENGLGNPKALDTISPAVINFRIILNGLIIEFQSARDLWFWAHGLQSAIGVLPNEIITTSKVNKLLN